ncbi:MAG TPA: translation elongation factor 4 [Actinomycetota bacterium]|jgi:GTP-binding protein LepA|nr:translation elongation factor 4 [Actinomycetota bacterium]
MDQAHQRAVAVIAHIDHGKSTLSDRLLQLTGTVPERDMREQFLDRMDLERERGITIKAAAVRMEYLASDGETYEINLIDTPGHVDFNYEVSRSLAACEGVLLLVDAAQGIEAQTLTNLYLAVDAGLEVIPVLNKIDLPAAQPDKYAEEIASLIGCDAGDVFRISAKTGEGVPDLLDAIVAKVPPPSGDTAAPLRALVFDSYYDAYRGVIAYVRVVDGELAAREPIRFMATGFEGEADEIGVMSPEAVPVKRLETGEVGYLIAGVKEVALAKVGDTVTHLGKEGASEPLPGYREPKPMVFAGIYPINGDDFPLLRDALDKLKLNDAALVYEPESSGALGFGFRCGFLGLLHMEIVRERLEREFDLELIATAPSVGYELELSDGIRRMIRNPTDMPDRSQLTDIAEPYVSVMIVTPSEFVGTIMQLCQERRGELKEMHYLSPERVELRYHIPLGEIIFDFFDQLKSRTKGYASLDYEPVGMFSSDLVRVDVLLNGQPVDAFSTIVHRDKAYDYGKKMTDRLRKLIPRQMFDVPIQAAIGSRIIARETVRAKRKDVTAKCYGGDITRKRKLLERQKEGKKRMKQIGTVEVPQSAFIDALKIDAEVKEPS